MKTTFFIFFAALISLIFSACSPNQQVNENLDTEETPEEELVYEVISLSSADFENCRDKDCPIIELNYLNFSQSPEMTDKINAVNLQNLANIFGEFEENNPKKSTYDLYDSMEDWIKGYKKSKLNFPDIVHQYEFYLDQDLVFENDAFIILADKFYSYTGGAHGYGATNYSIFNKKTGELLPSKAIVKDEKNFTQYANKKFREEFSIPMEGNLNDYDFQFEDNKFVLPQNIGIKNDSLILTYHPYEIAAYVRGQIQLKINKKEVEQWLNSDFK